MYLGRRVVAPFSSSVNAIPVSTTCWVLTDVKHVASCRIVAVRSPASTRGNAVAENKCVLGTCRMSIHRLVGSSCKRIVTDSRPSWADRLFIHSLLAFQRFSPTVPRD